MRASDKESAVHTFRSMDGIRSFYSMAGSDTRILGTSRDLRMIDNQPARAAASLRELYVRCMTFVCLIPAIWTQSDREEWTAHDVDRPF